MPTATKNASSVAAAMPLELRATLRHGAARCSWRRTYHRRAMTAATSRNTSASVQRMTILKGITRGLWVVGRGSYRVHVGSFWVDRPTIHDLFKTDSGI